jgi:hypothetical protein
MVAIGSDIYCERHAFAVAQQKNPKLDEKCFVACLKPLAHRGVDNLFIYSGCSSKDGSPT